MVVDLRRADPGLEGVSGGPRGHIPYIEEVNWEGICMGLGEAA
jgi:hypothetical protein